MESGCTGVHYSLACAYIPSNRTPLLQKHPKRTGAVLGVTTGILLAPVAAGGALTALGSPLQVSLPVTSFPTHPKGSDVEYSLGSLAATIQSSYTGCGWRPLLVTSVRRCDYGLTIGWGNLDRYRYRRSWDRGHEKR